MNHYNDQEKAIKIYFVFPSETEDPFDNDYIYL